MYRGTLFLFYVGVVCGSFLSFLIFHINEIVPQQNNNQTDPNPISTNYYKWFNQQKLKRSALLMDDLRYGNEPILTESKYLFQKVNILCLVLVKKVKNAEAINNTWSQNCNNVIYYSLNTLKVLKPTNLEIIKYNSTSSWELLCRILQLADETLDFSWAFFVNDDTFAILENLRIFLAPLNSSQNYYIGHSIKFWGISHNVAEAGYVLSKRTVQTLADKFSTLNECRKSGRFWKQEAYYLGKHLSSVGINPTDLKDNNGYSIFYGYNLYQILFPGSLSMTNYYKYSISPVKCCSKYTITFQAIESDKMYFYYFMLYHIQIFYYGNKGNVPLNTTHDDSVWKEFVRSQGIENYNISVEHYYELWKSVVSDPHEFNKYIRNMQAASQSADINISS